MDLFPAGNEQWFQNYPVASNEFERFSMLSEQDAW